MDQVILGDLSFLDDTLYFTAYNEGNMEENYGFQMELKKVRLW